MKQILFCTKYERLGASSRLRTFQYLPYLNDGYDIRVNSLFSNEYVANIYKKEKQAKLKIFISYIRRFLTVLTSQADIIIIEKELFPYLPYFFEKLCLGAKKYIIDIDDAIFHKYDLSKNIINRIFLRFKFHYLFRDSSLVLAGSPYLAEYAKSNGAKTVVNFPTVIDLEKYIVKPRTDITNLVIGWVGTNITVKYLDDIIECLNQIAMSSELHIELWIVGSNRRYPGMSLQIKNIPWTEETEVEIINNFDIGIMPLKNTPWENGKCAYKLIQYMGCAKPVVASAIGANNYVVNESCGYLCKSPQDWLISLTSLIASKELRQRLGSQGRRRVEEYYNLTKNVEYLQELLNEILLHDTNLKQK